MGALKETKTSATVTTRTSMTEEKPKAMPKDAEIISQRDTVEIEEIENGFLVIKNTSIDYRPKGSDHTDYMYITKKWYSETNPMEIKVNDESLAEVFNA